MEETLIPDWKIEHIKFYGNTIIMPNEVEKHGINKLEKYLSKGVGEAVTLRKVVEKNIEKNMLTPAARNKGNNIYYIAEI